MQRYEEYREAFRALTDSQLISAFNREVGNNGWTSARGAYLRALHDAFEDRGFDYSAVGNERGLSLRSKVRLKRNVIEPLHPSAGPGPAMLIVPDL
jgi:hypothetical protein